MTGPPAPNWGPLEWSTAALWALVVLVVVLVVAELFNGLRTRDLHRRLDAYEDWMTEQLGNVHTRLDRAGAPGIHPTSPPMDPPAEPPTEPEVFTGPPTVHATAAATPVRPLVLGSLIHVGHGAGQPCTPRCIRPADMPTPEQRAAPTRPDFAAQPKPGRHAARAERT